MPRIIYQPSKPLPLHGFHFYQQCLPINQLTQDNRFAFRVWVWRDPSTEHPNPEPDNIGLYDADGFVSRAFEHLKGDNLAAQIAHNLSHTKFTSKWKKKVIMKHVDRQKGYDEKSNSPYVSISLSLIWAIHNALWYEDRPYFNSLSAADIRISIVRLSDLDDSPNALIVAASYTFTKGAKNEHDPHPWRCSSQSQEVLAYGRIPSEAVVSTVSLQQLRSTGLPEWMNLDSLPQAMDYEGKMKRRPASCKYAVHWAEKMRNEVDTERCVITLALAVLGVEFTRGSRLTGDSDAMIRYLLQWPFRVPPSSLEQVPSGVGNVMMSVQVSNAWEEFGGGLALIEPLDEVLGSLEDVRTCVEELKQDLPWGPIGGLFQPHDRDKVTVRESHRRRVSPLLLEFGHTSKHMDEHVEESGSGFRIVDDYPGKEDELWG